MLIDLTVLSQYPRSQVDGNPAITKFMERKGVEQPPVNAYRYVSYNVISFQGDPIQSYKNMKLKGQKIQKDYPGLHLALLSMKKAEKSWFRIGKQLLGRDADHAAMNKGLWYEITLQDFKLRFENQFDLQERIAYFNQYKQYAEDCFRSENYALAVKYYSSCANLYTGLPRKLDLDEQRKETLRADMRRCQRNTVVAVIRGKLEAEYDNARTIINQLVEMDASSKNLYLKGRLLMLMKYLTDAKQALTESYKLEQVPQTLYLINSIRDQIDPQEVYKYVIENLEAERIRESKSKKKELKQEWLQTADEQHSKQLVLEKMIQSETLDLSDLSLI